MIREQQKQTHKTKKISQIIGEYLRTAFISFLIAILITSFLSYRARNEMLRNIYLTKEEKANIDRNIALKLVEQTDYTESLSASNYSVCMQVGNIYDAAGQYDKAEFSYRLATTKTKPNNYTPYYKLIVALNMQDKLAESNGVLKSIEDTNNRDLIKFKTMSYLSIGDKYYSVSKFLKAAKSYEEADFYYKKLKKQDFFIAKSIQNRLVNSYIEAADFLVKNGYNSEAVKYLKKAQKYNPEDFKIKYKLAVIYSDLDPCVSIEYFEDLMTQKPQIIDYSILNKTLIKAANIAELEGNYTKAKYYRYKNHSIDLFTNNKVVYKNDLEISPEKIDIKKILFKYKINGSFSFINVSATDITKLNADFVLKYKDKTKEVVTIKCATKSEPLMSNSLEPKLFDIQFGKNIFTKKELEQYTIELYLYKDKKFKTKAGSYNILPKPQPEFEL